MITSDSRHDTPFTDGHDDGIGPEPDGRQSARAAALQRGVCRLLYQHGLSTVTELTLAGGRRADVVGLSKTGALWIVEIKSSVEDYRSDGKWTDYHDHCDRLFFAVPPDFPLELIPESTGLIVADQYGGEIIREAAEDKLSGGRRKAVTLRYAHAAALRLHGRRDPGPEGDV